MDVLQVEIYDVSSVEGLIEDVDEIQGEVPEVDNVSGALGNFVAYKLPENYARENYVHKQGVASNEWLITHNLNKYCSVVVVDSTNQVVFPEVFYIDANTIKIKSNGAFAGWAYCN